MLYNLNVFTERHESTKNQVKLFSDECDE